MVWISQINITEKKCPDVVILCNNFWHFVCKIKSVWMEKKFIDWNFVVTTSHFQQTNRLSYYNESRAHRLIERMWSNRNVNVCPTMQDPDKVSENNIYEYTGSAWEFHWGNVVCMHHCTVLNYHWHLIADSGLSELLSLWVLSRSKIISKIFAIPISNLT